MNWCNLSNRNSLCCLALQVAIDSATPIDDAGPSGNFMMDAGPPFGGYGGPLRNFGRMYGSLDFDDVSIYNSIKHKNWEIVEYVYFIL